MAATPGILLFYGDSNTWGYDPHSMFGDSYPAGVSFVDRVTRATSVYVENAGQCGRSIPKTERERQVVGMILERLLRSYPQIKTFIMLGTNDFLNTPGITAEEVAERMGDFVDWVKANFKDVDIILVAPPPMSLGSWTSEDPRILTESGRYPQALAKMAEEKQISFIDTSQWGIQLAYDGVHFSEDGHRIMAEKLIQNRWIEF